MKTKLLLLFVLLVLPFAYAQELPEDAGITPDSFVWGLDKAIENINLLLTFDKAKKAEKRLQIAQERLLEVKSMIEQNKLDKADKSKKSHEQTLEKVKQNLDELKKEDTEQVKDVTTLESALNKHESKIEELSNEVDIKIELNGELTEDQKSAVRNLVSSQRQNSDTVNLKIKIKKDELKIKLKEKGKTEQEIEKELETEDGITKEQKASESIKSAEAKLSELKTQLPNLDEREKSAKLLKLVEEKLTAAKTAFENKNFGRAYGLANAAEHLATNGLRRLENLESKKELKEEKSEAKEETKEREEIKRSDESKNSEEKRRNSEKTEE